MNTKNKIKTILTFAVVVMTIFGMATSANADLPTELGILDVTANGGINPATGAAWAFGETYRLVFVSSATTQATSNDLSTYDEFLQGLADAAGLGGGTWKVIGSSGTEDARDHTSTNTAVNGTGEAIFLLDGNTIVANDYADLWDNSLDHQIDMDENGAGGLTGRIFAGTNGSGTKRDRHLGGSDETTPKVTTGEMHDPGGHWLVQYNSAATSSHSIYGLSDPLTIGGGDPNAPTVDAGVDMITWSGQGVQLAPTVENNNKEEPPAALTYAWSADPPDGVVFSATDVETPTITITKATDNPSVVTLTLAVNNVGRVGADVESIMTIDVYDDACEAAKVVGTVLDETDFDANCITNLKDFAILALDWLSDYAITAPVPK